MTTLTQAIQAHLAYYVVQNGDLEGAAQDLALLMVEAEHVACMASHIMENVEANRALDAEDEMDCVTVNTPDQRAAHRGLFQLQ